MGCDPVTIKSNQKTSTSILALASAHCKATTTPSHTHTHIPTLTLHKLLACHQQALFHPYSRVQGHCEVGVGWSVRVLGESLWTGCLTTELHFNGLTVEVWGWIRLPVSAQRQATNNSAPFIVGLALFTAFSYAHPHTHSKFSTSCWLCSILSHVKVTLCSSISAHNLTITKSHHTPTQWAQWSASIFSLDQRVLLGYLTIALKHPNGA